MRSRTARPVAMLACLALLAGAFVAGPADAKKKKKKKPPACAPYTPWEKAAEVEVTKVTDAATEEAPIELTIDTAEGLGFSSSDSEDSPTQGHITHAWANVQVDPAATSAGLYVRVEFPAQWDYDLFLRNPDGSSEFYAAGGHPIQVFDGTGHGGHSELGAEQLDGILSADCQGYSVDIASAQTPGGDVTLKLWLGEPGA